MLHLSGACCNGQECKYLPGPVGAFVCQDPTPLEATPLEATPLEAANAAQVMQTGAQTVSDEAGPNMLPPVTEEGGADAVPAKGSSMKTAAQVSWRRTLTKLQ